jgi:hypothetical protein
LTCIGLKVVFVLSILSLKSHVNHKGSEWQ